jgi:hypothetical protein
MHSNPFTNTSPSDDVAPSWSASWASTPAASQKARTSSSAPFIQQEMLWQTSTR